MKLLFIGDIVGASGLKAVKDLLPGIIEQYRPDVIVANGENAAHGFGITRDTAQAIFNAGVDVITSGNHIWDKKNIISFIRIETRLLRPANYPQGVPGRGSIVIRARSGERIGIINLAGRIFMEPLDCPFQTVLREIETVKSETSCIVIDMHAEATSEKIAMGCLLDGQVSAVLGTHTHVQTADERILPSGTAFITDVGMTGSLDSVIGLDKQSAIQRFLTQMPMWFKVADAGIALSGVLVEIDAATGKSLEIKRILKQEA